ncbi:MAG TPA: LysR family transcriptional regulator [Gammaproteobacteria bacterium]|nr:LysR family transcriptional regulator [Gammaproteobacteria bacterium]
MDHISRVGVFLEVAKNESFAGAARALGLTGPAISKQVQSLEDQLGVKLLSRTTRHVALTEEGVIYFDKARKALEDLDEAEQQIQELKACPTGKLKVNAPMSFGTQFLTRPIAAFAEQYPEVELEIDFSDRRADIVAEGFDVVIRIGLLEDSTLIARKLAPCPIILCAGKKLIKKYGLPESAEQLSTYPGIVYNKHAQKEEWRYRNSNDKVVSQTLNRNFAANTAEMLLEACLRGLGIALLAAFSADSYLKSGELVELFPDYPSYPEPGIYAMYPQNRYLSTRTRLFIDWLSDASKDFSWY